MIKEKIIYYFKASFIFAWVILLALLLRWSILEVYVMPFHGMLPTLFPNDHVIVNKLSYGLRIPFVYDYVSHWSRPKRGEVIIFRSPFDPHSLSIRRVIGVPGDRVLFENGNLYVNEQMVEKTIPNKKKIDASWLRDEDFSDGGTTEDKSHYVHWEEELSGTSYSILVKKNIKGYLIFGPYIIPPGHYFVMGDHRDRTQDSRTWPAQLERAKGVLTFSRVKKEPFKKGQNTVIPKSSSFNNKFKTGQHILIPKGTIVRTNNPDIPEYFETTKEVTLKGLFVDVEAKAVKAGLAGNVGPGQVNAIESPLSQELNVSNNLSFAGGKDENLVFYDDILGRVSHVWFSCEKNIKVLNVFCDPRYIRWGRTFLSIH